MPFIPLTPKFLVSPQLHTGDLKNAKEQGVSLILCNRPDGETPDQPTAEDIKTAASELGLSFSLLPITEGISREHMSELKSAIAGHSKILAYCKSGTRSALLWVATHLRDGADLEETLNIARQAGYDFSTFREALSALAGSAGETE